jgi:hypothetical protein
VEVTVTYFTGRTKDNYKKAASNFVKHYICYLQQKMYKICLLDLPHMKQVL